jgi:hypothetical protein
MAFSQDELVFLRSLAGNLFGAPLATSDPSKDAVLTRKSNLNGAGYVPDDPGFYTDLKAYSEALGFDPLAMLVIIASESNFNTGTISPPIIATPQTSLDKSLIGHDLAPRGLIGFTAINVPTLLSAAEWDALPTMTAKQQLAYVVKAMKSSLARVANRPFSNAYELYLANASPASLTASGKYDLTSTLYSGNDWLDNLGMDHGPPIDDKGVPQGDTAYSIALKTGQTASLPPNASRQQKLAFAGPLVQQGRIKGKVTLGDLQKHSERMNQPGWNLAWQLAARRYQDANTPIVQTSFESDKPFAFPDFTAQSLAPSESKPGAERPGEPIAVAPNGALIFPQPQNIFIAVASVVAVSAMVGIAYAHSK